MDLTINQDVIDNNFLELKNYIERNFNLTIKPGAFHYENEVCPIGAMIVAKSSSVKIYNTTAPYEKEVNGYGECGFSRYLNLPGEFFEAFWFAFDNVSHRNSENHIFNLGISCGKAWRNAYDRVRPGWH